MVKIILIVSVVIFSIGCANSSRAQKKAMKEILPVVLTNDFSSYARDNSETQILNAFISDSTLTLKVSYSGGCEVHSFELIGSKMIQKSLPPIRGIMLIHNSNNDDCRAIVEQELRFNVSKFKYPGSSIILNLKGWKPKIELKSK
jgi:hypothetical protein